MFEVDFLQTSTTEKSADAIAARFSVPGTYRPAVIVVDAGYTLAADAIAAHVRTWYGTDHVDLVINTHPDADHLNGIGALMARVSVGELMIHQPRCHGHHGTDADCAAAADVVAIADKAGVPVTEPFQSVTRFNGALTVVGPSEEYYEQLLNEQVGTTALIKKATHLLAEMASVTGKIARRIVLGAPMETLLDDSGGTSPRNNSSVILSIVADGQRALLTGDAGVPALTRACDWMEATGLTAMPINLFQIPHHGSRHNLDGALLDRLLQASGSLGGIREAVASASALDPKHPHPAVSNAVKRRNFGAFHNGRGHLLSNLSGPGRVGWTPAEPMPWYEEDGV